MLRGGMCNLPRVTRDTGVILPRQDASFQRREYRQSQSDLLVQIGKLGFDFCSCKHIILRLLNDWTDKSQLVSVFPCRSYLISIPFRSTPIECLAIIDDMIECSDRLLDGCVTIWAMCVDDIYVVET